MDSSSTSFVLKIKIKVKLFNEVTPNDSSKIRCNVEKLLLRFLHHKTNVDHYPGSTRITFVTWENQPSKNWQVGSKSLGDAGFLQLFRVVSSDYGKSCYPALLDLSWLYPLTLIWVALEDGFEYLGLVWFVWSRWYCWWFRNPVNSPVEGKVVNPHYLQFFLHPRWLFGISSINSISRWKSVWSSWGLRGETDAIIFCHGTWGSFTRKILVIFLVIWVPWKLKNIRKTGIPGIGCFFLGDDKWGESSLANHP